MSTADEVVLPALIRAARGAYGHAVRERLARGGFDDLPRNAAFVLGGLANRGGTLTDLLRELGVTKQAASQLVDTLVLRGYLMRDADPDDRRRLTIAPTERGRAAAAAVRDGVESVDAALLDRIGVDGIAGLRRGLVALIEIREALEHAAHEDAARPRA